MISPKQRIDQDMKALETKIMLVAEALLQKEEQGQISPGARDMLEVIAQRGIK